MYDYKLQWIRIYCEKLLKYKLDKRVIRNKMSILMSSI